MEQTNTRITPKMLTIRQMAREGPLSEYALRQFYAQGRLPGIACGNKFLINRDRLIEKINDGTL